ncbi:hypothetical protein BOH66_16325 [Microbacterium aurum]|uniref:Gfo/Idh/MocA-like oxidoreductase N-terminal domain-containing protein n=1 Tax=Microbacterium aurum TaxID=36805 RepID=A0A1P8UC13_9MICO|nr:Gfo/Idh/MocA family oxidoreductase [Microbacterium aurum]APZ35622.1 hypothetical protein BOH66_16325 [Microbacterium aurum]MBM7826351.1 putative dehydrogenase [Microbacterium aurum]
MTATRIGIVGFGEHVREALIPALAGTQASVVRVGCDPENRSALEAAQSIRIVDTYRDVVHAGDVDAVIVAATPQLNSLVLDECLVAGKPVFVEKPMAVSVEDSQRFRDATRNGHIVGVGHNFSFSPAIMQLKRWADGSTFGDFTIGSLSFHASKPNGARWGLVGDRYSFLLSHATHALDIATLILGAETRIEHANMHTLGNGNHALVATLGGSGGVLNLHVTNAAPRFSLDISLVGSERKRVSSRGLRYVDYEEESSGDRYQSVWRPSTLHDDWDLGGYVNELTVFLQSVESGVASNELAASVDRALMGLELIDQISKQSGVNIA